MFSYSGMISFNTSYTISNLLILPKRSRNSKKRNLQCPTKAIQSYLESQHFSPLFLKRLPLPRTSVQRNAPRDTQPDPPGRTWHLRIAPVAGLVRCIGELHKQCGKMSVQHHKFTSVMRNQMKPIWTDDLCKVCHWHDHMIASLS